MTAASAFGRRGLSSRAVRRWSAVHRWSSLACTTFLLMLCATGLPLIFHREIDGWLTGVTARASAPLPQAAGLSGMVAAGERLHPGARPGFLNWDPDLPGVVILTLLQPVAHGPLEHIHIDFDAASGELMAKADPDSACTDFLLSLHKELLLGTGGALFLGAMGLLFVVALVSGVVLYGPFTHRLAFGTVRRDRSRRVRWLDLHNLLGITTVAWALVVGLTGVINTVTDPIRIHWQKQAFAAYRHLPPVAQPIPVDRAVAAASQALPGTTPYAIVFPGASAAGSPHHFSVFMRGRTLLGAHLFTPVLVNARSGQVDAIVHPPWDLTILLLSRPLHYGDYGGLPLKILWALLDLITIVVLGSGLYLWAARRRSTLGEWSA